MSRSPDHTVGPSSGLLSNVIFKIRTAQVVAMLKGSRSTRKALPFRCVYDQRHKGIFPPGFDSTSFSTEGNYYPFSPQRLYDALLGRYHPDDHVEHIVVRSAWYCKLERPPQHEFILIEVEDTKAPGLINFIALDRNRGATSALSSIPESLQSSSPAVAMDAFNVSYNGDKSSLLKQCGLTPCSTLEELTFQSDDPLLLYQLAILAWTASTLRDQYHVIASNCYWFAGLIWDCMSRMRPGANHRNIEGRTRGRFRRLIRHRANDAELELTHHQVKAKILNSKLKLADEKKKWAEGRELNLRQQFERAKRRLAEFEAEKNQATVAPGSEFQST